MKIKTIINILTTLFMGYLYLSVFGVLFNTKYYLGFNILKLQYIQYLILGLIFIVSSRTYFTTTMKLVYMYYVLYWIMWASGYYDVENQNFMALHYYLLSSIVIHNYYVENGEFDAYAKVIFSALIFIAISSVLNIVQLQRYPEAARTQFLGVDGGEAVANLVKYYTSIGVAGYVFISGIPFVTPILISYYKSQHSKLMKIVIIVFVISIAYSTLLSSVTTPLLMVSLAIIFAFLGVRRFKASLSITFVVILLIIAIPTTYKAQLFYKLSDMVSNKDLSVKMNDIGLAIESGVDVSSPNTSIEYRAERIPRNIEKFLTNPILGTGVEENAHIFWLNLLAQFGLIGTIPLVLILYRHISLQAMRYDNSYKYYYLVSIYLFIALGFMKAITGPMMYYLLMLIPGMYYLRYLRHDAFRKI